MSSAGLPAPNISDFTTFLYTYVGIPTAALPSNSITIPFAFDVSMSTVNESFECIGSNAGGPPGVSIYTLMVYLLGTSLVLAYAQDVTPNPPTFPGSNPPVPYFQGARQKWNINDFIPGVIQSSSDEGTSQSFVVQEAAKNFTLANLDQLKDPWGRRYLGLAQAYGPSVWGLTC